jgi:hypothetical protein
VRARLEDVKLRRACRIEDGIPVLVEDERSAVCVRPLAVHRKRALGLAERSPLLEEHPVPTEPDDECASGVGNAVGRQEIDEIAPECPREVHRVRELSGSRLVLPPASKSVKETWAGLNKPVGAQSCAEQAV